MTEPEPVSAAAVAGLASEVETLRRTVDPLPERVDALAGLTAELAAQLRDRSARPQQGAMPSWLIAPADAAATRLVLDELAAWLDTIFLRYVDGRAAVPECWLWHPDVVEELLWLMHAWLAAYQGEKASIALVGDWHDRYRPGVVRRIRASAGMCSLEVHVEPENRPSQEIRRPDAAGVIADWWAKARDTSPPAPTAEHLAPTGRRR